MQEKLSLHTRWENFKENNILMNFTVMLVPHRCERKPIHFNFKVGAILGTVIGAFSVLLVLLSLTTYFAYSAYRLHYVSSENARLNKISTQQAQQLERLETEAAQVFATLDGLKESDKVIRDTVGLPTDEALGMGGPLPAQTARAKNDKGLGDSVLTMRLDTLEETLRALNEYGTTYLQEKQQLSLDATDRVQYLASLPNGLPVDKVRITSDYGSRVDPFTYAVVDLHDGIDFAGDYGLPIYAAGGGVVTSAESEPGLGNALRIDHGYGYTSIYGHCQSFVAKPGQTVKRGDVIAYMGSTGRSTGPHVHLSVTLNGNLINPASVLGAKDMTFKK